MQIFWQIQTVMMLFYNYIKKLKIKLKNSIILIKYLNL